MAICDAPQCGELTPEEEKRMEANKAAAIEMQAKRGRTANSKAEATVRK